MKTSLFHSLWRPQRGEGRLPAAARALPAPILVWAARRRRRLGFYDIRTLALYRAAWQRRRSAAACLDYALYRRDMGYSLPERWVASLAAGLDCLRPARRRLALALIRETAGSLDRLPPLPPASRQLRNAGADLRATVEERQQRWREDFTRFLIQRRTGGICVVGNAGSLKGAGHGSWIDGHAVVARFNRFRGDDSNAADLGTRLHVWIAAPDFSGMAPPEPEWAIVSGPDMRFRLQNWGALRGRLETENPVLTVPLPVWRDLVARTQAPPSAGLLLLAWLKDLLGSWEGIATVGIGVAPATGISYHHADPRHTASSRHQWEAERVLLRQWREEGLRVRELL